MYSTLRDCHWLIGQATGKGIADHVASVLHDENWHLRCEPKDKWLRLERYVTFLYKDGSRGLIHSFEGQLSWWVKFACRNWERFQNIRLCKASGDDGKTAVLMGKVCDPIFTVCRVQLNIRKWEKFQKMRSGTFFLLRKKLNTRVYGMDSRTVPVMNQVTIFFAEKPTQQQNEVNIRIQWKQLWFLIHRTRLSKLSFLIKACRTLSWD